MTDERHLMICTDGNTDESLFECTVDDCGRRLVLDHARARVVVLEHGDRFVPHHGSTGLVALTGAISPTRPHPTI